MFTHRNGDVQASFVKVSVEGSRQPLRLTAGHYLYVNGKLQTARTVKVGDTVQLAAGAASNVTGVAREWSAGLFNPNTLHGDIIVDGVLASTYADSLAPALWHALQWPLRTMYRVGAPFHPHSRASGGPRAVYRACRSTAGHGRPAGEPLRPAIGEEGAGAGVEWAQTDGPFGLAFAC